MNATTARTCAILAALLAATARAGVNVEVGNGDKVTGTLSPATEVEVVRFRVPKGAVISVKGAAAKKGPQVRLDLKSPSGATLASAEGKSASIAKQTAAASGLYSVEITSMDHATTGDYTFSAAWKSPTSFGGRRTIAGGSLDVDFAADAGAAVTFAVKPVKNSPAVPALSLLTYVPELSIDHLFGTTGKRTIGRTGDCVLTVTSPVDGDATATVRIKPPKAGNRKYALTSATIGGGDPAGDTAFAAVVGPLGGLVAFPPLALGTPGSRLDGSSVEVPPAALPAGTALVIATAPDVAVSGQMTGAGPTVFFGPEGTRFDTVDKTAAATVTIPYDPALDAATATFVVYTRDAKGKITAVPQPYAFDHAEHTVSFATSHFSSFRAAAPPIAPTVTTTATILGAQDICVAHEPTTTPNYDFFVASGSQREILGLRPPATTGGPYTVEVYAGGGALTTDGTPRTQYLFPPLVAVTAADDGTVYAASSSRVYKIGTDGNVSAYAGSGQSGDTGDGFPATSATFQSIRALLADKVGNLWIADAFAHRIRYVDVINPIIQKWVGTGTQAIGVDGEPVAQTALFVPSHMAFAHDGGLYVADAGRVRHIDPVGDVNVTVVGDPGGAGGTQDNSGSLLSARFQILYGLSAYYDFTTQKDVIAATDDLADCAWLFDLAADKVTRIGGVPGQTGDAPDTSSPPSPLSLPLGIVVQPGRTFFVDSGNGKIRQTAN